VKPEDARFTLARILGRKDHRTVLKLTDRDRQALTKTGSGMVKVKQGVAAPKRS